MIAIANAVRPLKAKLQRKRTLRLIITQQGLDLTMYAKILIVTQYITYHDTCMMSCWPYYAFIVRILFFRTFFCYNSIRIIFLLLKIDLLIAIQFVTLVIKPIYVTVRFFPELL